MKVVLTKTMRELEAGAISAGINEAQLMQIAASGIRDALIRHFPRAENFAFFCGKGNNGGDGRVCAKLINSAGKKATVFSTDPQNPDEQIPPPSRKDLPRGTVCIDALLGIGFRPPLSEKYAAICSQFLQHSLDYPVLAIDLPSGVDSDNGQADCHAVRAGITVTCGLPKLGLFMESSLEHCGRIDIAPLPLVQTQIAHAPSAGEWLTAQEARQFLPHISWSQHKRRAGRLHIVAGSEGMLGAAILTIRAAIKSGAGLVTAWVPESAYPHIAVTVPEAIVRPRTHLPDPSFSDADAAIIGPGLGVTEENKNWLKTVLEQCQCPLLLDADALNLLSQVKDWQKKLKPTHLLTPHAGEWSRLLNTASVPREQAAEIFTSTTTATFLLKGPSSLTAAKDHPQSWNSTGNPALATAGSGDVLSGICGALLAKKLSPYDAARLGSFLHGLSADIAIGLPGEPPKARHLAASDIIEHLPAAAAWLENCC